MLKTVGWESLAMATIFIGMTLCCCSLPREKFDFLLIFYTLNFGIYAYVLRFERAQAINFWLGVGIISRVLTLPTLPNLSDDYFRFLWDGELLIQGINPYAYIPSQIGEITDLNKQFFQATYPHLNSPNYFSVYPPVCQYFFAFAQKLEHTNLIASSIILKVIILIFELGTLKLIQKLLNMMNLSKKSILIYALNPLIIIEICNNLHFEGVMLFFLLAAFVFILYNNWLLAAMMLSLSVHVKLVTLLFLPLLLLIVQLVPKKAHILIVFTFVSIILWLPFLDELLLKNFTQSLNLYIQHFEFNASIYYLLRWLGYIWQGYNMIAIIGMVLLLLKLIIITFIIFYLPTGTLIRQIGKLFLLLLFYYLLSTVVHPWYLVLLIGISCFLQTRIALLWSFVAFFSYSAYTIIPTKEQPVWLIAEYFILFFYMVWEWKQHRWDWENIGPSIPE
ncbi:MAG: hypothetical protein KA974_06330 [Saprospiraceae bacterium]|nr:hypothetical protein [Saprospiraceae bacterium]MBP7699797.1 hypothetical protein [Saprospiraceae bacterium]